MAVSFRLVSLALAVASAALPTPAHAGPGPGHARFVQATGTGFWNARAVRIGNGGIISPGETPASVTLADGSATGGGSTGGGVVDSATRSVLIADIALSVSGAITDVDSITTKIQFGFSGSAHWYHPEAYTGRINASVIGPAIGFTIPGPDPAFFTVGGAGAYSDVTHALSGTTFELFPSGSPLPPGTYFLANAAGQTVQLDFSLEATDLLPSVATAGSLTATLVVPTPSTAVLTLTALALTTSRRRR